MENQNHETQSFDRFKDRLDMMRRLLDQCELDAPTFDGSDWESLVGEVGAWVIIARVLAREAEHLVDCAVNCANAVYETQGSVRGYLMDATEDAIADAETAAVAALEENDDSRSDLEEHGFGHAEYGIKRGRP